jgi:hypothetical protein
MSWNFYNFQIKLLIYLVSFEFYMVLKKIQLKKNPIAIERKFTIKVLPIINQTINGSKGRNQILNNLFEM